MRPSHLAGSLLASLLLVLSACDRPLSVADNPTGDGGGAVSFRLADSLVPTLSSQADSVRLTLHRTNLPDRSLSAALGSGLYLDNLATGDWNLEVALYRRDGSLTWYGASSVTVVGGRTASAVVHLRPATGSVSVQIVLDSVGTPVVVRRDTVVPFTDTHAISGFRQVLWAQAVGGGIEIGVVYDPLHPVPTLVRVDGEDATTLEVGDPFFECGGIVGPCKMSVLDTNRVQVVFVSFANLSGSCFRTVQGSGPAIVVTQSCRNPMPREGLSFTRFDWVVQGGFSGRGSGEEIHLNSTGFLQRMNPDALDGTRIDTTWTILDSATLAHVDSVLSRADVRALPAPMDTAGAGQVADGYIQRFQITGPAGTLLDLSVGERFCPDIRSAAVDGQAGPTSWTVVLGSCSISSGMQALNALVVQLRSVAPIQAR